MPIVLKNLSKSFDGKQVLSGFSHTFADESVTCITGPSGCGKTTLLNILLGLLRPDSGEIHGLSGKRFAAVFQEDRLMEHCSPTANLRAVLRVRNCLSEIHDALDDAGLADAKSQPVRELSGGMKRRVAILRALLAESDVLVMDEPFRGLDSDTRDRMIRFIRPRIAGKTVIVVTHDSSEAQLLGGTLLPFQTLSTSEHPSE